MLCRKTSKLHTTVTMGKKSKAPVYIIGVGMTKFVKPRGKVDYTERRHPLPKNDACLPLT